MRKDRFEIHMSKLRKGDCMVVHRNKLCWLNVVYKDGTLGVTGYPNRTMHFNNITNAKRYIRNILHNKQRIAII